MILFCSTGLLSAQEKLTSRDILNREMIYSFTGGDIRMLISSDTTIFWRDDSKPREAHEKAATIHVNPHTILTSWYESDKTFVTLLSDFAEMKVSGMIGRPDGKVYGIKGTIKLK